MKELIIKNPQQMEELGVSLAKDLKGKEVICLIGELGAGKTTLVKGIARGIGIKEGHQVRSPTFTLVNEYPTDRGKLIHIDLYRVKNFDWREFIGEGVLVIEWAQRCDECTLVVEIDILEGDKRRVRLLKKA